MKTLFLTCCVLAALTPIAGYAQSDVQSIKNISQELVRVRQEIEALHSEINFEKDGYRDKLRAFSNQKSDLSVKINREELNVKELESELKKVIESNQEFKSDNVKPVLKQAIAELRAVVDASIPFKKEQRLQALQDIETRLDTNLVTTNKAANQLWAYVEDELVLGRSSGIFSDTMDINGQPTLVKVLRLGKVAMFYQTQQEAYGVIKKSGQKWQIQAISDVEQLAMLDNLFDSFNKNIRTGIYSVPNFLPES